MRFLPFGFLTLDFLGAIFFWYFSLRKKNSKIPGQRADNLREIKCWYDVYEHHILDETIRRRYAQAYERRHEQVQFQQETGTR